MGIPIQFRSIIPWRLSGPSGARPTASRRRTYSFSPACNACGARWFRLGIALVVLVAVAAIFIAPSIDLPNGVLKDHSALTHASRGHALGSVAVMIATNSPHSYHLHSEMRASDNRPSLKQGHEDQHPYVLRC